MYHTGSSGWPEMIPYYAIPYYNRTCETDAMVALMKWRNKCDRSPGDHGKIGCIGRAPSAERCCVDGVPKDTKQCGRSRWWPNIGEWREAAICGWNCNLQTDGTCHYGVDQKINNPRIWCGKSCSPILSALIACVCVLLGGIISRGV